MTKNYADYKIERVINMCKSGEKVRIPKQERSLNTKKQIIEAAMKLFSEKGYHGTNTKEIAKEAGVATGCFYSYFIDKRAVFKDAIVIYCDQFNNILRDHVTLLTQNCISKKDFFVGLIKSLMDAHKIFTEFHNELYVMSHSDKEIHDLLDKQHEASIQFTLSYLKECNGSSKVSDLEAAARIVYWSVHSIVDNIMISTNQLNSQKLIDETVDMILSYLFKDSLSN